MQPAIDIEVQVVKARDLLNPHAVLGLRPTYYISLSLLGIGKQTQAGRKDDSAVVWEESFVFSVGKESTLKIEVFCMHTRRMNHIVGHVDLDLLTCERNKDFEVLLHNLAKTSAPNDISGFLTLHLKVAFSVTFDVHESKAGLRSLAALHQMDKSIKIISEKELQQLPPMWMQLLKALDVVASFAGTITKLDSRAQVAVGAVVLMFQVLVQQMERDEKIEHLGLIMADLHTYVRDGIEMKKITTYEKALERLLEQTTECAYFVAEYRRIKHFVQRTVVNIVSNADGMIRQFEVAFGELKIGLILGSSLQTAVVSFRILQTVEKIESLLYINNLRYLEGVGWDSSRTCLRGTRESVIQDIVHWASSPVDDPSNKRIYLLTGPMSCGKSAIAHTVAQAFSKQKRLAASVFLKDHKQASSLTISSSILYQLAHYNQAFMRRMADRLMSDVTLTSADIGRQFSDLLVGALSAAGTPDAPELMIVGPVLLILDNIHQVSDQHEQYLILTSISEYFALLPSNFRLLLTSRQGDLAADVFSRSPHLCHIRQTTHENDKGAGPDEYMTWVLEQISSDTLLERYTIADLRDQLTLRSCELPAFIDIVYRFFIAIRDTFGVNEMVHTVTNLLSMPIPLARQIAMDNLFNQISSYISYSEYSVADLLLKYINALQPISPASVYTLISSRNIFGIDSSIHDSSVAILQRTGLLAVTAMSENGEHLLILLPSYRDFLMKHTATLTETVLTHSRIMLLKVCDDLGSLNHSVEPVDAVNFCGGGKIIVYNAFVTLIEEVAPDLPGCEEEFSKLFEKLGIFLLRYITHWIDYMKSSGHGSEVKLLLTRFHSWSAKRLESHDKMSTIILHKLRVVGDDMLSRASLAVEQSSAMDAGSYNNILRLYIEVQDPFKNQPFPELHRRRSTGALELELRTKRRRKGSFHW